jgi:hypothetical protein
MFGYGTCRLEYDDAMEVNSAHTTCRHCWSPSSPDCLPSGDGVLGRASLFPLTITFQGSLSFFNQNLPTVSVFQTLHFNTEGNQKRLRLFWYGFAGMFAFEVIPAYMFPLLNGVSIICLATQHASPSALNNITNIFGGSNANEGLGLFNFSFDWQYLGSYYLSVPLIQQGVCLSLMYISNICLTQMSLTANSWVGIVLCYIAISAIYYSNTWNVCICFKSCRDNIILTSRYTDLVTRLPHALDLPVQPEWYTVQAVSCLLGR